MRGRVVYRGEGHSCRVFGWCERGEVRRVGSPVGSGAVVGVGPVRVDHRCGLVRPADPRWVDGGWHRHVVWGVGERVERGTVRDAVADIRAHREAAKAKVRQRVGRGLVPEAERKRLYTLLTRDRWAGDPLVRRWMRCEWWRGHNHTSNQLIIRADKVRTVTVTEGGEVWLSVPGLAPGAGVVVPPAAAVGPAGTLRVILRGGRVEVHYQVEDTAVRSARRGCGTAAVGVDKGYSEVLVDTDGEHHGPELGELLRRRCDTLKERNARRAELRSIANQAAGRGRCGGADPPHQPRHHHKTAAAAPLGTAGPHGDLPGGERRGGQRHSDRRGRPVEDVHRAEQAWGGQ
jgi:hypothetical protein